MPLSKSEEKKVLALAEDMRRRIYDAIIKSSEKHYHDGVPVWETISILLVMIQELIGSLPKEQQNTMVSNIEMSFRPIFEKYRPTSFAGLARPETPIN